MTQDTLGRARELVDHFIMTGSGEAAEILTELLAIAEEKELTQKEIMNSFCTDRRSNDDY